MRVVTACLTPCCSVEITSKQIHVLILHNGTNCKEELLSNTSFRGTIVVDVQRHDREGMVADEKQLLRRHLASPIQILLQLSSTSPSLGVVKIERRDLDVGEESIFVEQESTPAVVSHMEAVRQQVVLEVLDGFASCKVMMCHFSAM